ncbi:hypothetical protein ATO4_15885 [Aurantimonas sp. 22II-16-19i]|nr:hypothetical protein ATO4_15885 [Aurantimonas sp. 22II-16-19i]
MDINHLLLVAPCLSMLHISCSDMASRLSLDRTQFISLWSYTHCVGIFVFICALNGYRIIVEDFLVSFS